MKKKKVCCNMALESVFACCLEKFCYSYYINLSQKSQLTVGSLGREMRGILPLHERNNLISIGGETLLNVKITHISLLRVELLQLLWTFFRSFWEDTSM
jgi:hypothetical protein